MSGAEIISLISSTITIIQAVREICNHWKDADKLPLAMREVRDKLPIIVDTLERAAHKQNEAVYEKTYRESKSLAENCQKRAKKLEEIFQSIAVEGDAPLLVRYRKAVKSLGKGNQVEVLTRAIVEDVRLLVDNHAVRGPTEEQISELRQVIEDLSNIELSVSDDESSGSSWNTSYGSGAINVNSGSGTMNAPSGDSKQFLFGNPTIYNPKFG